MNDLEDRILKIIEEGNGTKNKDIREALFPDDADFYILEIDKALQTLRKAKKIFYTSRGWVGNNLMACPTCKGSGFVHRI